MQHEGTVPAVGEVGSVQVPDPPPRADGPPSTTVTLRISLPDLRDRLRRHLWPVAFAMVLAQLAWKGHLLSQVAFMGDDYNLVVSAVEHGLSWDHLGQFYNGHFMPVSLFVVWAVSAIDPYNWALALTATLALQLVAALLLLALLRELVGPRLRLLLPLGLYLVTPLTVPSLLWWAAAVQALPLQIALLGAVLCAVRWLRGGRWPWLAGVVAATLLGLGSSLVKAVVGVPLLLLWTGVLLHRAARRGAAPARPPRDQAVAGAGIVALCAAAATTYLARGGVRGDSYPVRSLPDVLEYVDIQLGQVFAASAFGWPVNWIFGHIDLSRGSGYLATALLLAAVALTVHHRRGAAWAWALVPAYVVFANVLPVLAGRAGWSLAVASEARYLADAAVPLALALAVAVCPLRGETRAWRRRPTLRTAALAALLALLVLAGSLHAHTRQVEVPALRGAATHAYLESARGAVAAVADGYAVYPTQVPDHVMDRAWAGDDGLTSHVLRPFATDNEARALHDPPPTTDPWTLTEDGRLARAWLEGVWVLPDDEERCFSWRDGTVTVADITTSGSPAIASWLHYDTERALTVIVELGEEATHLRLPPGEDQVMFFPTPRRGEGMRVTLTNPDADLCLRSVASGVVVPAE